MKELIASFIAFVDLQIFLFLNHLPHNMFTDELARIISGIGAGGAIFIVLGLLLFYREERKDHTFIITVFGTLLTTWVVVEEFLKPWFGKMRPHAQGDWGYAIIVDQTARGFSFPSSHAALAWALAVILADKEPSWRNGLYVLATCISLSRVFLGVHFPIDVFVGSILGWIIGHGVMYIFRRPRTEKIVLPRRSGTRQKKRVNAS